MDKVRDAEPVIGSFQGIAREILELGYSWDTDKARKAERGGIGDKVEKINCRRRGPPPNGRTRLTRAAA